MAVAFVEGQVKSSAATPATTPAFANSFVVGQLIVVYIGYDAATAGLTTSVTDSKGNTYTQVPGFYTTGGSMALDCWYAVVTAGGASPTVTVAFNDTANNVNVVVQYFNGFTGTPTFDKKSTSSNASSTTATSGATATTAQANELIVGGAIHASTTSAFSLGSGYTNLTQSSVANRQMAMESKLVAATGAQTATFTIAAARVNIGGVATFYDAPGGITTTQNQTGVTRITAITTRDQTGLSRIQAVTQRLQTGVANIVTDTITQRLQTAVSRIMQVVGRDQTGKTRVVAPNLITKFESFEDISPDTFSMSGAALAEVIAPSNGYSWHLKFDPSKWDNITGLYFETAMYSSAGGSVGVRLRDVTNNVYATEELSTTNTSDSLYRSLPMTIPSGVTEYTVYAHGATSPVSACKIGATRLVVQQGTGATKRQSSFIMASGDDATSASIVRSGWGHIWKYEADKFDNIDAIYFEATARGTTSGAIINIRLRDITTSTDIATISATGTTPQLPRSGDIKALLVDGHEYDLYLNMSAGSTAGNLGNARIIIEQSYFTKTQYILTVSGNGTLDSGFADAHLKFDPANYDASYTFDMHPEMTYVNDDASSSITDTAIDVPANPYTNSALTSPVGSTTKGRIRGTSSIPTPTSASVIRLKTTIGAGTGGESRAYRWITDITMPLTSATTTKDQTGIARITAIVSRLQTGIASILAPVTRDQTGVSRVTATATKDQTGVARVTAAVARLQTGVSKITATTTRDQPGVSRLTATTTRTQTGAARVQIATIRDQTGLSRITAVVARLQTGLARITAAVLRDQTGVSRLTATATRLQTGIASIILTATRDQTGVSRITATGQRDQTGTARVTATTQRLQLGLSKISQITLQTILGVAKITATTTRDQTGKSSILAPVMRTQTGQSRVTAQTARVITGVGRIAVVSQQTQTGVARVTTITSRLQTGVSRVTVVTARTQTGVSTILSLLTTTRDQTGKSSIRATTLQVQTGIARVTVVTARTQTGTSRLTATAVRDQLGKASLIGVAQQNQLGVASLAVLATRTQTGKSRVLVVTRRDQTGVARIVGRTERPMGWSRPHRPVFGRLPHRPKLGQILKQVPRSLQRLLQPKLRPVRPDDKPRFK